MTAKRFITAIYLCTTSQINTSLFKAHCRADCQTVWIMKKEYSIKKELKRLSSIRGSGTELVSVYIPPGAQISDITNKLKDERGQAANIKSKTTRTNVQAAIDRIVQYLKLFKKPPDNGLAVVCGNISNEQS